MGTIKPLPQSLRSSVRSGIVMFDLSRVIEELVFNSLDAAATKVSVFVGVGTFYLKVIDNGSGVTRDDLVLLGERYATSKSRSSDDTCTSNGIFGSHGEALASISDVSVTEIITKTHGTPNGYRKILKGCKCLHLGIDDDIKDVGTTVIVRDLFYNQPVRRKYFQSSPRKVLDSIKKSILRIALVHTEISFKVIDIESGNELLVSEPSSTPLSLLQRTFGNETPNALCELKASEGVFNLTGHISSPYDDFSFKAFQYVYINSRFICKGPIHKLVNQLAAKFDCSSSWKGNISFPNGKRKRPWACPAYLLRLNCPQSLYELSFGPSRTSAEFKDWNQVLTFVEKAVQHFWKKNIAEGKYSHMSSDVHRKNIECDVSGREGRIRPENFDYVKKRKMNSCSNLSSFLPDQSSEDANPLFNLDKLENPFQDREPSSLKFMEEMGSFLCINSFHQGDYGPLALCTSSGTIKDVDYQCRLSDISCFIDTSIRCTEGNVLEEERRYDSYLGVDFGSTWKEESHGIDSIISPVNELSTECSEDFLMGRIGSELGVNKLSTDSSQDFLMGRIRRKPFLQSCSSRGTLSLAGLGSIDNTLFQTDDMRRKQKQIGPPDDDIYSPDFFPMRSWHDEECDSQQAEIDFSAFSKPSMDSFSWSPCVTKMEHASPTGYSLNSKWSSAVSNPLLVDTTWNMKFDMDGSVLESSLSSKRRKTKHPSYKMCCQFRDGEETLDLPICEAVDQNHPKIKRSRRSHSAPPFHRQRRRFNSLNCHLVVNKKKSDAETNLEAGKLDHSSAHCSSSKLQIPVETFPDNIQEIRNVSEVDPGRISNNEGSIHVQIQDSRDYGTKWRDTCLQKRIDSRGSCDESSILDISSGFLYLAGDSLVPKSITKDCLFNAKVLQQVDKKFIPVVAGGNLALIDQHAADERIRLEDLRQKVLSGEARIISYLDSEKELLLPEIGYQLLHDYGEQIKGWGWICNIHSECSGAFTKNFDLINRQRTAIKLVAVPSILGVNLTDVDLLEYLQQLVDTDGVSTMPPAVVRVLNLKACRGAIMFGDSLLPSECSLIVDELKQTSLCFQCAHGRPTTVPLVNLGALHKQIPKLCSTNGISNEEPWHGLRRHEVSLERTARRRNLAMQ